MLERKRAQKELGGVTKRMISTIIIIIIISCLYIWLFRAMKLLTNSIDYTDTIKLVFDIEEKIYDKSVIFHFYWNGNLNEKCVYSVLSCYYFNVYKNKHKIIVWLENNTSNTYNEEISKYAEIRYFSLQDEQLNTGFVKDDVYYNKSVLELYSDFVRSLLLYNYGGVWLDLDCFVLRSFDPLFCKFENEICLYRWENQNYPNNAVYMSLTPKSEKMKNNMMFLIDRCRGWGCYEAELAFDLPLDYLILPCSWFDADFIETPYRSITRTYFFRKTDHVFNFDNFYKGSFCYHWHNQWNTEIENDSIMNQLVKIIEANLASIQ